MEGKRDRECARERERETDRESRDRQIATEKKEGGREVRDTERAGRYRGTRPG